MRCGDCAESRGIPNTMTLRQVLGKVPQHLRSFAAAVGRHRPLQSHLNLEIQMRHRGTQRPTPTAQYQLQSAAWCLDCQRGKAKWVCLRVRPNRFLQLTIHCHAFTGPIREQCRRLKHRHRGDVRSVTASKRQQHRRRPQQQNAMERAIGKWASDRMLASPILRFDARGLQEARSGFGIDTNFADTCVVLAVGGEHCQT